MGPSMFTSTVSFALALSFSTSVGILISCARTRAGSPSSRMSNNSGFRMALLLRGFTSRYRFLFSASVLALAAMGRVLICVDLVHLRSGELQLAAGNAQRQHQPLLGGFAFGALPLGVLVLHTPVVNLSTHAGNYHSQDGSRSPTQQGPGE